MKRLIECVPNFSEGHDLAKVDALVEAMSSVPGAWILDRTSDVDHNRSVITLAGDPEAVAEATIRGAGKAAELIDLTRQTGAHPRIGATDVIPLIPLSGISIEDCVVLARRVGREIWDRYRIPVYFYEAAATKPERKNLESVRKGQFEGLREDALRDPDRSPDIGEPRLHPTAGAIAVGVRKLLIAFNVHLNTSDVAIARKIARTIRFSSGGLRHVKAIGVSLKARDIAQVSMNLTDFEETPLHRVFEMVKHEAEHLGCAVTGSEIVGLIPRKAIELSAEYYLQLENFIPAKVLENRLETVRHVMASPGLSRSTVQQTPGAAILPVLETLREAGESLAAAFACPERGEHHPAETVELNLDAAFAAVQVFEKTVQLEATAAPSMLSDLCVLREMAMAAVRGALENVRVSLESLRNSDDESEAVSRGNSRMAEIEKRLSEYILPESSASVRNILDR